MSYEESPIYRDTHALLIRVSQLARNLENDVSQGDFQSLKDELVAALTCFFRASERPDSAACPLDEAAGHLFAAKVRIRILQETRALSRYIGTQLCASLSSILEKLQEQPGNER